MEKNKLLEVNNLKLYYPVKVSEKGKLLSAKKYVHAVDGVSFSVERGKTLGIVGESGCGKSTVGKVIVKLLEPTEGSVFYEGKDIFSLSKKDEKTYKRQVQIIFQDPYSSLDPRFNVGRIIGEPLSQTNLSNREKRKRVLELMQEVGLKEEYYDRYPHEFSGGQRQRIGIARALALNPALIVCDEPVSALDVSIQAQILNLMKDLQDRHALTYVFISHNLSVISFFCDTIAVMYLGNIVEYGDKEELFKKCLHPYTKGLMKSIPVADPDVVSMDQIIQGEVPSTMEEIKGCVFASRCPYVTEKCRNIKPELKEYGPDYYVACHNI